MPELPEVEQFRQVLLPLVCNTNSNTLRITKLEKHHRYDVSEEQIDTISKYYTCSDVVRKGKQLCLILKKVAVPDIKERSTTKTEATKPNAISKNDDTMNPIIFLYLHMGMTGCIRTPGRVANWGEKKIEESSSLSSSSYRPKQTKNGKTKETKKNIGKNDNCKKRKTRSSPEEKAVVSDANEKDNGKTDDEAIPVETSNCPETTDEKFFRPKYTCLVFQSNTYIAAFTDPRKFGSCSIRIPSNDNDNADDDNDDVMIDPFDELGLASDAYLTRDDDIIQEQIIPKLANQTLGIKGLILDQKRAVSGVGNWIADEVLYQCHIHPDQKYLTAAEATSLWNTLHTICTIAVDCLTKHNTHYPADWLFGYRWKKGKNITSKDSYGRAIHFLTSGGRTSAIIASIQKLYSRTSNKQQQQRQMKQQQKHEEQEEPKEAMRTKVSDDDLVVVNIQRKRRKTMNSSATTIPAENNDAIPIVDNDEDGSTEKSIKKKRRTTTRSEAAATKKAIDHHPEENATPIPKNARASTIALKNKINNNDSIPITISSDVTSRTNKRTKASSTRYLEPDTTTCLSSSVKPSVLGIVKSNSSSSNKSRTRRAHDEMCVPSDPLVQQEEKKQQVIRRKKVKTSTRGSKSDKKIVDDTSEIISGDNNYDQVTPINSNDLVIVGRRRSPRIVTPTSDK